MRTWNTSRKDILRTLASIFLAFTIISLATSEASAQYGRYRGGRGGYYGGGYYSRGYGGFAGPRIYSRGYYGGSYGPGVYGRVTADITLGLTLRLLSMPLRPTVMGWVMDTAAMASQAATLTERQMAELN